MFHSSLLRTTRLLAAVSAIALAAGSALAQEPKAVPVADLVKQVNIPHDSFTLPNGLRVYVHTDRKAPIVAVSVWYDIGSKNEPKGNCSSSGVIGIGDKSAIGNRQSEIKARSSDRGSGRRWQ